MTPDQRLIAYVRGRLGIDRAYIDNCGYAIGMLGAHLDIVEDRTAGRRRSTAFAHTPYRTCITHGTRHYLEEACLDGIHAWATQHMPDLYLGDDRDDLFIVLGTASYLTAWEEAVVRIAAETGQCVGCARAGMACLDCDPPKDDDHEPDPTDYF